MKNPKKTEKPKKENSPTQNDGPMAAYARYSGVVFQMIITIIAGVYAGKKLDEYLNTNKPYFTLALTLLSLIAALYFLVRGLTKNN